MTIDCFHLEANDWVPNNARLPVMVWRKILSGEGVELAEAFEQRFAEHGWRPDWRDGVFDYHHYHSTAHEALGVFAGCATLELGGPDGRHVIVAAGDALMLPVGTGHRCLEASDDFKAVGAYPKGQNWDICRDTPDAAARKRMCELPDPRDPV